VKIFKDGEGKLIALVVMVPIKTVLRLSLSGKERGLCDVIYPQTDAIPQLAVVPSSNDEALSDALSYLTYSKTPSSNWVQELSSQAKDIEMRDLALIRAFTKSMFPFTHPLRPQTLIVTLSPTRIALGLQEFEP